MYAVEGLAYISIEYEVQNLFFCPQIHTCKFIFEQIGQGRKDLLVKIDSGIMRHSAVQYSYFSSVHSHSLSHMYSKSDGTNTEGIKCRLKTTCIMHCTRHNGNIHVMDKILLFLYHGLFTRSKQTYT